MAVVAAPAGSATGPRPPIGRRQLLDCRRCRGPRMVAQAWTIRPPPPPPAAGWIRIARAASRRAGHANRTATRRRCTDVERVRRSSARAAAPGGVPRATVSLRVAVPGSSPLWPHSTPRSAPLADRYLPGQAQGGLDHGAPSQVTSLPRRPCGAETVSETAPLPFDSHGGACAFARPPPRPRRAYRPPPRPPAAPLRGFPSPGHAPLTARPTRRRLERARRLLRKSILRSRPCGT